jgi:SAM-dependent methyltransferase
MLDMGCGTGGVLRDWMDRNRCAGIDRSELALQICARRGFDVLARGDLTRLPFRGGSFDTVVLMDVIEHLEDDVGFLRRASEVCAAGGRIVIAVPAFQFLWSQHDATFQHQRRYSARQLEGAVRAAGLEPERTTYTNSLVFPVAAVWRLMSYRLGLGRFAPKHDFWPVPDWLNTLLASFYSLEAWLLRRVDLPVGVSVVCIARNAARPNRLGAERAEEADTV